jgi:hypothetical protein
MKVCYQGASMFHVKQPSQKTSHTTKEQIRNQVKPLQPDKDDATKKACSIIENPIYYALRRTNSLKGWQCIKHNKNNNIVIKIIISSMKHQGFTHSFTL